MVIAFRVYFVVLGLAAILGAERLSTFAASRWSRILRRETSGMKRAYRLVFIVFGVAFILFGLSWPPAWSEKAMGAGPTRPAGMARR